MKKSFSLMLGVAMIMSLFLTPNTVIKASAAGLDVSLTQISRPSEATTLKNIGEGEIYSKEAKTDYEVQGKITIAERGWFILDRNLTNYGSGGLWHDFKLCYDVNLTSTVATQSNTKLDYGKRYIKTYYLDRGTYYFSDDEDYFSVLTFGYFLPDSKAISHTLTKATDGSSYTTKVEFKNNHGTTKIVNSIVEPSKINDYKAWNNSDTNVEDTYSITKNGEYTVKATFSDTEWKDFPVMYSFSVYDIVQPSKEPEKKEDTSKNETPAEPAVTVETSKVETPAAPAVKVSKSGSKAIKVKWNKIADIKKYEIQYSTNKNFKKAKTKTCKAAQKSVKISKLKANKKYFVRMRCYKEVNGEKIYSDWSKTKTIKTK